MNNKATISNKITTELTALNVNSLIIIALQQELSKKGVADKPFINHLEFMNDLIILSKFGLMVGKNYAITIFNGHLEAHVNTQVYLRLLKLSREVDRTQTYIISKYDVIEGTRPLTIINNHLRVDYWPSNRTATYDEILYAIVITTKDNHNTFTIFNQQHLAECRNASANKQGENSPYVKYPRGMALAKVLRAHIRTLGLGMNFVKKMQVQEKDYPSGGGEIGSDDVNAAKYPPKDNPPKDKSSLTEMPLNIKFPPKKEENK